ncbi:MAG: molybdopterin molybdotransferase MoeA [Rhizobiaceae bacterium]|nr:molybdopterin molybdotransferase MoeA [Rhizobiaceae bacterium]
MMIDDCFLHDKQRLRHREAIEILKSRLSPIAQKTMVKLEDAPGKILAQDIMAPRDIPAFNNSAVDGYAFRYSDIENTAGEFIVSAHITAGDVEKVQIPEKAAARIFTGAMMPLSADSVAMQEDCKPDQKNGQKTVTIPTSLSRGANVRLAGEDVKQGEPVCTARNRLRPQDVAAIASSGIDEIEIFKPLKIALASTGDEIIRPGNSLQKGEVFDANHFMLSALLKSLPVEISDLGILPDDRNAVENILIKATKSADIIITSGGASMGNEDHITNILADLGTRHLWQLAIKPGRPMCFGQLNKTVFFGLPGNPVASFVCFLLYIMPSILVLGGGKWSEPKRYKIPSAITFNNKKPDRREFWRGFMRENEKGEMLLHKYGRDGSGLISGLQNAGGFIEIAEDVTSVKPGDLLDYIPFSEFGIV